MIQSEKEPKSERSHRSGRSGSRKKKDKKKNKKDKNKSTVSSGSKNLSRITEKSGTQNPRTKEWLVIIEAELKIIEEANKAKGKKKK